MQEERALLGLPEEFEIAKTKIKVYVPTGEWMIGMLGWSKKLSEIMQETVGGKLHKDSVPFLSHVFKSCKIGWRVFGWQKLLWFRKLNAMQQIAFFEQWNKAIDIEKVQDFFLVLV